MRNKQLPLRILGIAFALLAIIMVKAQSLDVTFGNNGLTQIDGNKQVFKAIQHPMTGKIYTLMKYSVGRLNTDGSIDSSFGINGNVYINNDPSDVIIQGSGKLVVATNSVELLRLNIDGTIDSSFDSYHTFTNGLNIHYDHAVKLAERNSDKKINLAFRYEAWDGKQYLGLIQTDSNGVADLSYASDGVKSVVTNQSDFTYGDFYPSGDYAAFGNFWTGSSYNVIHTKYDHDLQPISGYGNNGSYITSLSSSSEAGTSIEIENNGRLILGATAENKHG